MRDIVLNIALLVFGLGLVFQKKRFLILGFAVAGALVALQGCGGEDVDLVGEVGPVEVESACCLDCDRYLTRDDQLACLSRCSKLACGGES